MLQHVANFAKQQGLDTELGFAPKTARWAILCNSGGEYLGLEELGDTNMNKSPGRHFPKAPDLSQPEMKADGVTKSHFLIDTVSVVVGYGKDAEDAKTLEKRRYFVDLLERASGTFPCLRAAAQVLRSEENLAKLRTDLAEHKAVATDKATFRIGDEFPVESETWHEWWREFRRGLHTSKERGRKGEAAKMLCFLTGLAVEPTATHPKITGLTSVGGLATGDVLIGFKQESFCSYGLKQSANAAVSAVAAKAYQAGLNRLIANHSVLLAGTRVAHWFRCRIGKEDDPFDWIVESAEPEELNAQERARKFLESIRTGERPDLARNTYFALTISSNRGRVVVRDWMEGTLEELAANVYRWFSDLKIVHPDGTGSAKPPMLAALLGTFGRNPKDHASMAATLYRVAARGEPIPLEVMSMALAWARIDAIQGKRLGHVRLGLIKAYHMRKRGRERANMEEQLKPELNASLKNTAYQCGRLMAVLGKLQMAALGDVGAGVVQRHFAAASTTPALVFGRLICGAQFHLNKVADQKRGLAVWYEQQIREICGQIGTSMPRTLSLEDQSLFTLGYYQQLAALWAPKEKGQKEEE